jgi:hypothetical protein
MKAFVVCAALALVGCAAGTALIKAPVENKCAGYGLQGCGELVEGVVAYIDGDKVAGKFKLKQAAAKNSPQAIRPFAKTIKDLVPGEDGQAIAEILSGEVEMRVAVAPPPTENPYRRDANALGSDGSPPRGRSPARDDEEGGRESARARPLPWAGHVELALAAPVDPARLLTSSAAPQREPAKTVCEVAGTHATCVQLEQGPIVLTDAVAPASCRTELYIGALDATGRTAWAIQANAPGFQGGRYLVRSDQRIVVAARGVDLKTTGDDRCFVTWAGFRPRMVPQNLAAQE